MPKTIATQDNSDEIAKFAADVHRQTRSLRHHLLAALASFVISTPSFAGNPLFDTGADFVKLCDGHMLQDGSIEQMMCLSFYMGVVQGHQIGAIHGIGYGLELPDESKLGGKPLTKEQLSNFGKAGRAARTGVMDGYCDPAGSTIGKRIDIAIQFIKKNPRAQTADASVAIMWALADKFPIPMDSGSCDADEPKPVSRDADKPKPVSRKPSKIKRPAQQQVPSNE